MDFSTKLSAAEVKWAFKLVKANMEGVYDASGYGWDDSDKERELTEPGGRFLLVRERESSKLVGFCHFRFTVQGDGECLVEFPIPNKCDQYSDRRSTDKTITTIQLLFIYIILCIFQ